MIKHKLKALYEEKNNAMNKYEDDLKKVIEQLNMLKI